MVAFRKFLQLLPWVALLPAGIAVFEWIDYHVKGKSGLLGKINPRCTEQFYGRCVKLDTSDMPWDATAAVWLNWTFLVVVAALALIGTAAAVICAALLAVSVIFPIDKNAGWRSRLADSRWLWAGTAGWGLILSVLIGLALFWAGWELLAMLLGFSGLIVSMFAGMWVDAWASNCRHERDMERALREEAQHAAQMPEGEPSD